MLVNGELQEIYGREWYEHVMVETEEDIVTKATWYVMTFTQSDIALKVSANRLVLNMIVVVPANTGISFTGERKTRDFTNCEIKLKFPLLVNT